MVGDYSANAVCEGAKLVPRVSFLSAHVGVCQINSIGVSDGGWGWERLRMEMEDSPRSLRLDQLLTSRLLAIPFKSNLSPPPAPPPPPPSFARLICHRCDACPVDHPERETTSNFVDERSACLLPAVYIISQWDDG